MSRLAINDIGLAVSELSSVARDLLNRARRHDEYDYARTVQRIAADAERQFSVLSKEWSRLIALRKEADDAYDRYVTRDRECCSCHISAPCSFCTSQPDPDEEDAEVPA